MNTTDLLAGIGIGLLLAAPIGPIAILCMRRTLAQGIKAGFVAGLGAATGHALLSGLVSCGAPWLATWALWLRLIGGLVLLRLGWRIFNSRPMLHGRDAVSIDLWQTFFGTLLLQLLNSANAIVTILAYVNALTASEAVISTAPLLWMTAGVFIGSNLWWMALVLALSRLREKMTSKRLAILNRLSGSLVMVLGIRLLGNAMNDALALGS